MKADTFIVRKGNHKASILKNSVSHLTIGILLLSLLLLLLL